MGLEIVVPPKDWVIWVDELQRHLRLDDQMLADEAMHLKRLVQAVTDWVAGRDGWLGRSLVEQTLELTVACSWQPGFIGFRWDGTESIVLPRPPFVAVEQVALVDTAGAETIAASSTYSVHVGKDGFARLFFKDGISPPVAGLHSVKIRYRAGYGPEWHHVDHGLRQAMLMTVVRLFENRGEAMMSGLQADPVIQQFFAPYRTWTPPQ